MKWYRIVLAAMLALWTAVGAQSTVPTNVAWIHYSRPAAAFSGWRLHVWEDTTESVTWEAGLEPTGEDSFGVFWDVGLTEDAAQLGFIIHQGDEKDPGPDMMLNLSETREIWIVSGDQTVYTSPPDPDQAKIPGDLSTARAHWLNRTTLVWDSELPEDAEVRLTSAPQGGLEPTADGVRQPSFTPSAMTSFDVALTAFPGGLGKDLKAKFPYLADYPVYKTDLDTKSVASFLRGQLAVSAQDADGNLLDATLERQVLPL